MHATAPRLREPLPHGLDAHSGASITAAPVQPQPRAAGGQAGERVAITGSRERTDRATIEQAIAALPDGVTVITGGCAGPDLWAEAAARRTAAGAVGSVKMAWSVATAASASTARRPVAWPKASLLGARYVSRKVESASHL